MPTILSHPAVALGLRHWLGQEPLPISVVLVGALGSIAPDVDVIGFHRIPYGSTFGHRGFTHSIVFALAFAVIATVLLRSPQRWTTFAFVYLCTQSHGILDAMTNGGRGVGFLIPFNDRRYFFPWCPIEVSPIGRVDLSVLLSEARWVWLPMIVLAMLGLAMRKMRSVR